MLNPSPKISLIIVKNEEPHMIDWSAVLAVFSVYIFGVVSPGPNFLAVAHKAASSSLGSACV